MRYVEDAVKTYKVSNKNENIRDLNSNGSVGSVLDNGMTFNLLMACISVTRCIKLPSFMSTLSHSKHLTNDLRARFTSHWANQTRQARRPIPNGINFWSVTFFSNLSGLNFSCSSPYIWYGSLCMAHTFTNNIVPRGTSYPATMQSSESQTHGGE